MGEEKKSRALRKRSNPSGRKERGFTAGALRHVSLWRASLRGIGLWRASLRGIGVQCASLRHVSLRRAGLRGIGLRCAGLRRAGLWCIGLLCAGLCVGLLVSPVLSVQAAEIREQQAEEEKTEIAEMTGLSEAYLQEQLGSYEIEEIERGFGELFPGYQVDMEQMLLLIMKGQAGEAAAVFLQGIMGSLQEEFQGMRQVLISILVIGILSSLFSGFSDLFAGQYISQVGFYFLYLFLMAVLTRSFVYASETAVTAMENNALFVKLFIPTWFIAVGASLGSSTAVFYYQVMLLVAYLVENFLLKVLVPFLYSYVILALLNGIWAEERLALLLDFIRKTILFAQKAAMAAITGLSLVQSVILPVVDGLKISALRKAISAIPGIGGAAEGAAELVIGSAVLIKNSMGILLLLLLLGTCLLPLLRILLIAALIKLGAALTGIVSDKRISACADRVGEGCLLLFKCLFTSAALFLIVIAIVAYTLKQG